jgi:hypothetical protein
MNHLFDINEIITETNFVSPLMQDLSTHLSSNLKYPFVKCGYDSKVDSNIILMVSLSPSNEWDSSDFYKTPYCVFVIEPGCITQYDKSKGLPSFKKSFFDSNDQCCDIVDKYFSKVPDTLSNIVSEALVNLPKATISRDIQIKISALTDKISAKKLTYNQKLNVLSDILYSLKLDKSEMGKLLQNIKTTYNTTTEALLREGSSTMYYAFWNKKKYKVEGNDLWDAKQKAIKILKVPKNKLGMLAVVNADEHDKGGYKFEHIISEIDMPIKSEGTKKFYVFWKDTRYVVSGEDVKDAKQKAITALGVKSSEVGYLPVVSVDEHDSGEFQFDDVISTIKHPLIQQFNKYHDIDDAINLAKSSKNFKDFVHKLYDDPVMNKAYTRRSGFIPFMQVVFKHATQK